MKKSNKNIFIVDAIFSLFLEFKNGNSDDKVDTFLN